MSIRWFDGLRTNSISSFKKLTQSFCSLFITCSRVPQPLDSLLSMIMREGESVKAYAKRYWEMFNEIDGDFDEVTDDVQIVSRMGSSRLKSSSLILKLEIVKEELSCTGVVPATESSMPKSK